MSEAPEQGRILCATKGHVLNIGIDRPRKLNGFTPEMLRELAEAYTRLETEDDLRVGILHTTGANFTAGLQLDRVGPIMARGEPVFPPHCIDPAGLREPIRSKPLIAAVRGICFTVGIELMLAADMVVAGEDSRFAQLEVKRGIMPTGGATLRFVERCGWGNAQRLLLTGREFDAAEAYRLGLVQEVVAPEAVLARAEELAQEIAANAPLAVRASLASSRRYAEFGPIAAAAALDTVQRGLSATEDAAEGVKSFLERRPAAFKGR